MGYGVQDIGWLVWPAGGGEVCGLGGVRGEAVVYAGVAGDLGFYS